MNGEKPAVSHQVTITAPNPKTAAISYCICAANAIPPTIKPTTGPEKVLTIGLSNIFAALFIIIINSDLQYTILHEEGSLNVGFLQFFFLAEEKEFVVVMVKNRDGDNMIIMMMDLIIIVLDYSKSQKCLLKSAVTNFPV